MLLTHVNFRTGAMHDMAAVTAHCRAHGVPAIWDLSHSAGAVPLALNRWGVEYAVGCTYKFLNGGPGAPAYIYLAQECHRRRTEPVVTGWFSHANQFGFEDRYRTTAGHREVPRRDAADPLAPRRPARRRVLRPASNWTISSGNRALCPSFMIRLVDERLADRSFALASPREPETEGQPGLVPASGGLRRLQERCAPPAS